MARFFGGFLCARVRIFLVQGLSDSGRFLREVILVVGLEQVFPFQIQPLLQHLVPLEEVRYLLRPRQLEPRVDHVV